MAVATRQTRKAPVQQASLPLTIAEGVHIGLPEQEYFASGALGSSDFSMLDKDAPSWWSGSRHNIFRRDRQRQSRPLAFGSALHALVLEGEDAYKARFVVEPDPESTAYARNREAILKLLRDAGEPVPVGSASFDTGVLNAAVRKAGLAHKVWDTANAHYEAAKRQGLAYVTEDEDRRLRRMAALVAEHKDLGPNLRAGLPEVSVFWRRTEAGTRGEKARPQILKRCRFDYLIPGRAIDLKSFSNTRDQSPEEATFKSIEDEGYDLQAEHYREGLDYLLRFIREGKVHVWSTAGGAINRVNLVAREKLILDAIAAAPEWLWIWIFYQVQNDDAGRERAPVVVPWWSPFSGQMFDDARLAIERALDNYELWVNRAGLDRPWSDIRPIRQLPAERLKRLTYKRSAQ